MQRNGDTERPTLKRKTLTTAVSAALLMSGQVWAQAAGDDEDEADRAELGNITVTATRREQTVQDIPYNISAVGGSTIDDGKIVTSEELLRNVPGVAVVDQGFRNAGVVNHIIIRGLNVEGNANGDFALSSVDTVSTYVNDTPMFANFILKDLERVEILRGPQGTLYGSGSLGGTVRYMTRRPELGMAYGQVEGRYSQTDNSDGDNWSGDAIINLPIGDVAAFRFAGGTIDYDGITDYPNVYVLDQNRLPVAPDGVLADTAEYRFVEDADTVDIDYARASLLLEPNDWFSAVLTYQMQDDEIGGRTMQTRGNDGWGQPYEDNEIGSIQLEPSSREVDLASLEMEFDLGFATLTSSSSTYDHEGESISENTGFYAQNNWIAAFYYNYPRPMAEAQRTYGDDAFIQEIRLADTTGGLFDWLVGAFYMDQDLYATQTSWLRGFQRWADTAWGPGFVVNDNDFAYRRDENFTDQALFGEVTWHATDRLSLTGGARWFDNEYENDTLMQVGLYTSFNFDDMIRFTGSDSDVLFKGNFSFDLDNDHMLYGTISEGYRRGGANAVPLSGIFAEDPAWQTYEPDTVTNYELGIKGFFGSRTRYNASLFYVDWDNIQLNTATTNWGFFAAQNAGSARTQGIELELDTYLDGGFHLLAGYSYVDAELTEDFFSPVDTDFSNPIALDGTTLPGTPEHTINVAVDHSFNFADGLTWWNRIGAYYQSEIENAISQSPRFKETLSGFTLFDFVSTISGDRWSASFFIKNLTNEEGTTGVFKEEYMGSDPSQGYFGNGSKEFITRPRTIGVSGTWYFGD